ncbi:MAG: IgGFc-binding protein [Myxococcaceae bacterium]
MRRLLLLAVLPTSLLLFVGCHETVVKKGFDGGISCDLHQKLVDGECVFVCERDSDCAADQACDLFTGQCVAAAAQPDSGVIQFPCTVGATRCSGDTKSREACVDGGVWQTTETCPPNGGFCQNDTCLACKPGLAACDSSANNLVNVCRDDGSGIDQVTCSGAGVCTGGECRECAPNTTRCSPDGKTVQVCQKTADRTLQWKWANNGDSFDGTCITQVCEVAAGTARCKAPECFPGTSQCKDIATQQLCSDTGAWTDFACASTPGYTAAAECQSGVCIDECVEAANQKSYFGCEYWTAVQDNSVDPYFKGGTQSGQGNVDSDFAFVVSNRSASAATVKVERFASGQVRTVKTVTVPSKDDPTTKGLVVINVPWQSLGAASDQFSVSGKARYGYRLTSTRPVTVYQFNPLPADKVSGTTCSADTDCTAAGGGQCLAPAGGGAKKCNYFSYSNDASLLLPAHILGMSYVGMTTEHVRINSSPAASFSNAHLTIVGTQDNTTVTVKSSATTRAGTGVAAMVKDGTQTLTLQSYEVLQIASDLPSGNSTVECSTNPFDQSINCVLFGSCSQICRVNNDLTGTIITTDKPVAVFGGSNCALTPYNQAACDHIEEQLFPFVTWGKTFVAGRTAPLRLTSGAFASAANAGPDHYKIVAGCPTSVCPTGTLIQMSPAPTAANVLLPNKCATGSLQTNDCHLLGGAFMEFKSKVSFTITADEPIAVGQFFAGENATTGSDTAAEGDPSFVLLPPVEQWRSSYTVLAAPGIKDNYLGLVIDGTKVQTVTVDGTAVTGFTAISGTNYKVKNHPVSVGTHVIDVTAQPGVSPLPGVGVTVYGFDSYVSYGYTGGLDLKSLVSGINPGG